MEQPPRICPRCQQANFPVAEFCRHCGEPMYEMGPLSRSSLCSRCIGHTVDGAFWVIDELMRWWEIGGLTRQLKGLRRRRLELIKSVGEVPSPDGSVEVGERAELLQVSEEITRLSARDDTLRKLSWALTPELLLIAILLIFLSGIFWLRPRSSMPAQPTVSPAGVIESLTPFKDVSLPAFRLIETTAWYGEKLYVGGDGGLSVIDPQTGLASDIRGLPDRFFVRHLFEDQGRLLIAGLGGIWQLDPLGLRPAFEADKLPFTLINRLDAERKGLLIGTVGQGLMHGRSGQGLVVLGTAGLTILEFAWLDGELWLLHERGLLRGDGTSFASAPVALSPGTSLLSITPGPGALFVGTSDGVLAGFKQGENWSWTPLPSGPTRVTDLLVSGNALLVLGREGLFRWRDNRFDRLLEVSDARLLAVGSRYLALSGPGKVRFATITGPAGSQGLVPTTVPGVAPAVQPLPNALPTPIPSVAPSPIPPSPGQGSMLPAVAPVQQSSAFNGLPSVSGNPSMALPTVVAQPAPSIVPAGNAGFLNDAAMPASLRGPLVTSTAWDGARLWVGTANDGLWKLENDTWTAFQPANGGLADPQVVSLWSLNDRTFLFSWVLGLMTLDGGKPSSALAVDRARGFLALAGDPAQPLLLFEGGYLRRLSGPNRLEEVTRVPEDYYLTVRSLQVSDGKPVVITDQGFLRQDSPGHWKLSRFEDGNSRVRASISAASPDGRVFAGLSDGRVYQFDGRQAALLGKLDDRPRTLTWDGTLWAASGRQIHRLLDGRLQRLQFEPGDPIILVRPIGSRKRLIVGTTRGIQALAQEF